MTLPANWVTGQSFTATAENNVETAINQNTAAISQNTAAISLNTLARGGIVNLDSFTGSDDAKLTAALSYAAAQTLHPAIQLPARSMTFSTGGRTPYNGMRIIGPFGADGPKNPEVSTALTNHIVTLNVGNGASAWFNSTGTVYDVYFGNIAFQSGNSTSQFWNQPSGTLYACQFHSLTFEYMLGIFGLNGTACNVTQVTLSGHWEILGFYDTQFNLGGSDCDLSMGYFNISTSRTAPANGRPYLIFNIGKTKVGYLYPTVSPAWTGLSIIGTGDNHGISFYGGTFEGLNSTPATYPLLNISGGALAAFYGTGFHYINPAAGVNGAIVQSGGNAAFDNCIWDDANSANFTFLYQTGGHATISNPYSVSGNAVKFRQASGTTVTASPGVMTYA